MSVLAKPPVSILDPEFVYVPAEQTNIALTFRREIAKLRNVIPDDYEQVRRDDWMEIGGFRE